MEMKEDETIFSILFLGDFNTGKSTIINALIGDEILPISALVTTAVICKVLYGRDTEHIKVFKNGSYSPEIIPFEHFVEEYRVTDDDIFEIEETGSLGRLGSVDYVALESEYDLFRSGLQCIDTPGLGEADTRIKAVNTFIPQADAVVFVLNATHLLSSLEKQYIERHFACAEPKPRNVFFAVNRINQCDEEVKDAIQELCKVRLESVFTVDGVFDEKLYSRRVFFIDAYNALQMKKDGREPLGTGMVEFQSALEELRRETAGYKFQMKNDTKNPSKKGEKNDGD